MKFNPRKIRRTLLGVAIALLAVVIGLYAYARYKVNKALNRIPEKIAEGIQQSTKGFTFTKSENGRKQFTISAATAVQYKNGLNASLRDVRIIVYGRGVRGDSGQVEDRYDQIFGKEFEYDQKSGEVSARGIVDIDLEHHGVPSDDPMKDHAEAGSIHLKTSGLVFSQKTGLAQTKEAIEFSLPQASGSAKGAIYDSKEMKLTLMSEVRVKTQPSAEGDHDMNLESAEIRASQAVITDSPRQAELDDVHVEQGTRVVDAAKVRIHLRPDSTIDHVNASGRIMGRNRDPRNPAELTAAEAAFTFGTRNVLRDAVLTGAVSVKSGGSSTLSGSAGRVRVRFASGNEVRDVQADGGVNFEQRDPQKNGQSAALRAPAAHFAIRNNQITSAETEGASQLTLRHMQSKTLVTADSFGASFAAGNRMKRLRGAPSAKIVFGADQQQRTTSSNELIAHFDLAGKRHAQIQSIEQNGNFHYLEGTREGFAEHARYQPEDESITATGSPRFEDSAAGLSVTANTLRFNRRTNSVEADGEVKTTYTGKPVNSGALLGGSGPVHVTSARANATSLGKARFSGDARLWQQSNIIEAGTIDFDRQARMVAAKDRVQVNFAQADHDGKLIPVAVTADRLAYSDEQRKATFIDSVRVSSAEMIVSAKRMEVLLKARGMQGSGGQLSQIIASGEVQLEQRNLVRTASGAKLLYSSEGAKFVLTGAPGKTASIFDAERGNISADSLTFFSRDDTVQIGSGENSRVVTTSRIKEDSPP